MTKIVRLETKLADNLADFGEMSDDEIKEHVEDAVLNIGFDIVEITIRVTDEP